MQLICPIQREETGPESNSTLESQSHGGKRHMQESSATAYGVFDYDFGFDSQKRIDLTNLVVRSAETKGALTNPTLLSNLQRGKGS